MRSPEHQSKRACHEVATAVPLGITSSDEEKVASRVARVAVAQYEALSKTGKPQQHEHTVMCAFVLYRPQEGPERMSCVALGTGTKCLSGQQRSPHGHLLNDMHAEAVARRALLRWLLAHMERAFSQPPTEQGGDDVFEPSPGHPGRLRMREGLQLHMYISAAPCGDAAVFDLGSEPDQTEGAKGPVHRTGAKALTGPNLLPQQFDVEALQAPGQARRKPVLLQPEPALVQGSLLSGILSHPVRPATVTVAAARSAAEMGPKGLQASRAALHRALVGRCECLRGRVSGSFCWSPPAVFLSDPLPPALRICLAENNGAETGPSGFSINYSSAAQMSLHGGSHPASGWGLHEVTQRNGRKAGASKKAKTSTKTISTLTRVQILSQVLRVLSLSRSGEDSWRHYREAKLSLGKEYQACWKKLREEPSPFSCWIDKPEEHDSFWVPQTAERD